MRIWQSRQRARGAAVSLCVSVLCAVGVYLPQAADANAHHYCSSCRINHNGYIQDPQAFYLTASYVHWLGTSGNRYLGVSATSDPYVHAGYNEVVTGYPGSYGQAQAYNLDVYSFVTVNAHADF